MVTRAEALTRLATEQFDALVIGGGIVGAGIARDAAMRGLKVALIEQGDFASGTSSKTSKLIHGGLRYLEHGHVGLVRESLRERQILRTIAPGLVWPLSLLLPVYRHDGQPAWQIRLGLSLYDWLALGHNLEGHRMLSRRRALTLEPGLAIDGLKVAGLYADCQMDDARLCLANVLQAVSFGAVCANYVCLQGLLTAGGTIAGGAARDLLADRYLEIRATVVVNATGPWTDRVRRLSDMAAAARIAPTKGIHLVIPRVSGYGLFTRASADGRRVFILPWGRYSLVGTTESPVDGELEELQAGADEVAYLLDTVHTLLPATHVREQDILGTFAGARPLLAFSGPAQAASREHRIEVDRFGLMSVMGGKYTTYRVMAKQAVDYLVSRCRLRADRCLTDQVGLMEEVHPMAFTRWGHVVRAADPEILARLMARYGVGALQILALVDRERSLARAVCPHHEYIEAEIVYAIQHELACTITDVLARRMRIAYSSCQGLDFLSTVVMLFERYAAASRKEMEQQVAAYQQFLTRGLAFRPVAEPVSR